MAKGAEMIIKISGNAKNFDNEINKLEKNADRSLSNVTKQAKIAGAALAATAAAIGISAFNEFAKFEKDFLNVITLLDEGSFKTKSLTEGIKGLKDGVLELSAKSGQSFDVLNKGLFDLISAGVDAESAIEALAASTNLAIAGATDTATAVDGVTNALGAYKMEADQAQVVSEKFFTAQKFGKTTIEEIASGIGTVAASAKGAGISFDELLASTAAVTTSAIGQSEAFTGLKAAIGNINAPAKAAQEEAERLGISFDTASLRSKGLKGFLDEITNSAKFNDDSLKKLFGSQEALNFMLALTGSSAEGFNKILEENSDAIQRSTTFNNALETQMSSTQVQMDQLSQSIAVARVQLGEYVAPSVISFVKELTDSVNDNKDSFILLGQTIEKFLQVVSLAKNFIFGLANIFTNTLGAAITGVTASVYLAGAAIDDLRGKTASAQMKRDMAAALAVEGGGAVAGAFTDTTDAITGDVNSIFGTDLETSLQRQRELQDAKNALLQEGLEEEKRIRLEAEEAAKEEGLTKGVESQTEDQFEETAETQEERLKRLQEARDKAAKAQIKSEQDLTKETEKEKEKRIAQAKQEAIEKTKSNLDYIAGVIDSNTALGKALKVFRIANAIMTAYEGATRALADYPAPYSYAVAATTLGAGLANVASIRGVKAQRGGVVPGLGAGDRVPAMLEAGEIVVPKKFNPLSPDFESTFGGGIGGGQVNVMIGIEQDASRIITARQIEDQKLGVSR